MAALRDFAPRIQAYARTCPIGIITAETLLAIIKFCRSSGAWAYYSENDVYADVDTYVLSTPQDSVVAMIQGVYAFGLRLKSQQDEWPLPVSPATQPYLYRAADDGNVQLYPVPSLEGIGALVANVTLQPAPNATSVPDFLLSRHRDAITSGALSSILGMVGQPWANPQLALFHMKNFKSEIAKVRIAVMRNKTAGTLTATAEPIVGPSQAVGGLYGPI